MKHVLFLSLLFLFGNVKAATITWTGTTSTDWHDASNWDLGSVPNLTDDVIIGISSPASFSTVTSSSSAIAKSLTILNGQLTNSSILVVLGTNLNYPTTIHFDNAVFINNGVFEYSGGLKSIQTTINNTNVIRANGSEDNSPISLELDNNSTFNNSAPFGQLYFENNIESTTGFHKEILLHINNSSSLLNNGLIRQINNISTNDWTNKGIVINNNSTLINQAGFIVLESVREIGIHIKNDLGATPFTNFENRSSLSITKCTTCNYGEFTCGIRTDENAQYDDYPITSTVTITDFTDVNDDDICVFGTIGSFGSLGGTAVDMGNYSFDPTAVLQGSGVIIIDDGVSSSFEGTLSPGLEIAKLVIQGPFTSTSNTKFQMQLEGNGEAGMMMGHDQIDWGTDETDISMATLIVDLEGGFIPEVNNEYQLFIGTALAGEFENLELPGDNDSWEISYDFNGDGANDGVLLKLIAPINNINNTGIGTLNPRTKLEINGGDILLSSIGAGVVLTSPGGLFFKVTVDDDGNLQTQLIPCPEVWECP